MEYKNLEITSLGNNGEGITKIDNKITFVPYALSNEIIDINLLESKKKYNNAILTRIVAKSIERTEPICKYYYKCGGCDLMHMNYSFQTKFKSDNVSNIINHVLNTNFNNIKINYDHELNYRNHIILHLDKEKIGFFSNNTNSVIDIDECLISNNKINDTIKSIRNFINKYPNHCIKNINIRAFNEVMIDIESFDFSSLLDEFIKSVKLDSLFLNGKHVYGKTHIKIDMCGLKFIVSPKSFFQVNNKITEKLYNKITSQLNKSDVVGDLYCGTGTITLLASLKCKSVIGIEMIESSIKDAKENIKLNNIKNVKFILGKVENNLNELKNVNTIILDPPRSGCDKKLIDILLEQKFNKIIYVSCNPLTLSRDLNNLKDNYEIRDIELFDMFPNTHHVECVCVLNRRQTIIK